MVGVREVEGTGDGTGEAVGEVFSASVGGRILGCCSVGCGVVAA